VPDEDHTLRHVGPGVLSMVSPGGPGNATSQFYIAMARSPFMDYQNLVFGNVIAGMEALRSVEERVKTLGGAMVTISKCGEIRYDPDSPQTHHQPERA
jgi:peptidyl-prolyl isomerase F (cyclophilin D)